VVALHGQGGRWLRQVDPASPQLFLGNLPGQVGQIARLEQGEQRIIVQELKILQQTLSGDGHRSGLIASENSVHLTRGLRRIRTSSPDVCNRSPLPLAKGAAYRIGEDQ
jgi:hypothetical protein